MSDILIEVEAGKSRRLNTANKVCKDDIIVTATGGSGGEKNTDLIPYAKSITFDATMSEVTEPIVLHLEKANSLGNMFFNVYLHCPKMTIYISNTCASGSGTFRYGAAEGVSTIEEIEIIGDTSNITTYNQMFNNRRSIKRILGEFNFSKCTNAIGMFGGNLNLQEFYPVANTIKVSISFVSSSKLIDASIQAIIDGLADLTGATSQTITFHNDVVLSEEQKAAITLKNWTLVQ